MDGAVLPELMGLLEAQDELFTAYFARYRALQESRRSSSNNAPTPSASGDNDTPSGAVVAAPGALQGMLSSIARLTGSTREVLQQHQRRCLEDTGDPVSMSSCVVQ